MYSVELCLEGSALVSVQDVYHRGQQSPSNNSVALTGGRHVGGMAAMRSLWNSLAASFRAPREGKTLTAEKLVHRRWV